MRLLASNVYFMFVFLWSQTLLVGDELLLHEQVVFDSLLAQQLQATARVRQHLRQLVRGFGSLRALLLLADARGHGRLVLLLLILADVHKDK